MIKQIKKDWKGFYMPLILSILISYIFYVISIKERIPVFSIEPLRTIIIDSKTAKTAPIRVIGPDSLLIKNDLSATTFHFWNRGGEAIEQSDILQPLHISLSDTSAKFIDARIIKTSRRSITKPIIKIAKNKKELEIHFFILEEGDGITCQVFFEGNPQSELTLNGIIKGVKGFDNSNVSILLFASITLALCSLATIAIFIGRKLFKFWTYATYRDYYVDNFYYLLDTKQFDKAKEYTFENKRSNDIFSQLYETYSNDKDKFKIISDKYIKLIQNEAKIEFYHKPIIRHQSWILAKQIILTIIYIIITYNTWIYLKSDPKLTNPINKSTYFTMIKDILLGSTNNH